MEEVWIVVLQSCDQLRVLCQVVGSGFSPIFE